MRLFVSIREAAVRPVRLLAGRPHADLQERLRGPDPAGPRRPGGLQVSGPGRAGPQPSEEHQGPVPGHLQREGRGRPADLQLRPAGLQPGPVQPEPSEHAQ